MSQLRPIVTLSVALLAALAFTGCVGVLGANSEDPETPNGLTPAGNVQLPAPFPILPALATTITGDNAAQWVADGSIINVAAAPLAGASGDVQIAWYTGPLSGTAAAPVKANAQTGYIESGNATGIKYTVGGVFFMHCHPHPWMRHNVTVVDGWQNPDTVEVQFVDGAKPSEFRFVPENITIHPGTTVVYRNLGQQTHTATQLGQDAPLKKLDITGLKGAAKVQGVGWQRIVLLAHDAAGHYGHAEYAVYATSTLPAPFHAFYNLSTAHGAPDAVPAPASGDFDSKSFKPDYNGTMFVNFTASPAAQGTLVPDPAGVSMVQIHVKEAGIDQDAISSESANSGNLTGRSHSAIYTIIAKADQGVSVNTMVEVTVLYDLVPPPPSAYVDPESQPHHH